MAILTQEEVEAMMYATEGTRYETIEQLKKRVNMLEEDVKELREKLNSIQENN